MVWGSFRDWDPSQTIGEAEFVGLKNYITLWDDPNFRESLSVTLRLAFFVVTFEMVIGVGLALLLDRNICGMSVLRKLFIIADIWQWTPFIFILAVRVSRTATEFRELGIAAAMSNYLLILLLFLTLGMFAVQRIQKARAARLRVNTEDDS